jgi:hypothetical protein
VDGVLKHVFVGFYLCFPFVCSTHTLTHTHTRPRYQRNLSFILYFPSMGLRQRFFVRWRLEVDRYLKFFSLSPLSLLRFSVAVYLTLLPRDFFCGSEFEDVESTAEVWGKERCLWGSMVEMWGLKIRVEGKQMEICWEDCDEMEIFV